MIPTTVGGEEAAPKKAKRLTKREARRLAVLVIQDVIDVVIECGRESEYHPETNERLTHENDQLVRREMRAIYNTVERRLARTGKRVAQPSGTQQEKK